MLTFARSRVARVLISTSRLSVSRLVSGLVEGFDTLVQMQEKTCKQNSTFPAIGYKDKTSGNWSWVTYHQLGELITHFRSGLSQLGVKEGDKIAIISNNRLEWAITAYSSFSLGAMLVPMYENQLEKDWQYILKDCGAKMLITSNQAVYDKTKDYKGKVGRVDQVLCIDLPETDPNSYLYHLSKGKSMPSPQSISSPSNVASIIYTSGTTGKPKGVELLHSNIVGNLKGIVFGVPEASLTERYRSMSFLPWAHCYGQVAELHAMLSFGGCIGIVPEITKILDTFGELKPDVIYTVPLLLKKVYDGTNEKVAAAGGVTKALFKRAFEFAERVRELKSHGYSIPLLLKLQHGLFDRLVFSKVRERLGGNMKYMFSGGAATPIEILKFFDHIGVPVMEGYGLSEAGPLVTISSIKGPEYRKVGTVGVPLANCDIRIVDIDSFTEVKNLSDEGEIWVRSPGVMRGYYNLEEENSKTFAKLSNDSSKSYLRTGDKGFWESFTHGSTGKQYKYLKLSGRIKELYKLENGKYVAPSPIEEDIRLSRFIAQCVLYGDNRPHNICLVVPDFIAVRKWLQESNKGFDAMTNKQLVAQPDVKELIVNEIKKAFPKIKSFEKPRMVLILDETFTQENGMATAKFSIQRNNVIKVYKEDIEKVYGGTAGHEIV